MVTAAFLMLIGLWALSYYRQLVVYKVTNQGAGFGLWSSQGAIYLLLPGDGTLPIKSGWYVSNKPRLPADPLMEEINGMQANRAIPIRYFKTHDQFQTFPVIVLTFWFVSTPLILLLSLKTIRMMKSRDSKKEMER